MVNKWQAAQSLSPMDDYPLHQIADTLRHVGTSDRNFYDRYYFNLHNSSGELFMVMGLGQYPNLAVQDAFVALRRGSTHRVVRASRELGDRFDTSVGPIRIEVLEGLNRLRFVSGAWRWTWSGTARYPPSSSRASTCGARVACSSTRCASRRRAAGAAGSRSTASATR